MLHVRSHLVSVVLGAALTGLALPSGAATFGVTNLVSDDAAANPAQLVDPGLLNAWGISHSPSSAFWVSSNGAGTSVLYRVDPLTQTTTKVGLTVTIPGAGNVTGQVFNGNASAFNGDAFLFVSEDGTISGWRGALGSSAETLVLGSPANVYKGAALARVGSDSYLYGANFRSGNIDVLGSAGAPALTGTFVDPNLPSGFAPFNVQNLGGVLYVAYAKQDDEKSDEVAGPGLGFVDRFDLNGNLLGRVASAGTLDAPWGLALAPASFGALAGSLLVGNFGDGRISIFDAATDAPLGQVLGTDGLPLSIDGLWALAPGNGGNGGSDQLIYFSAGPGEESHGLFGVLTPVPEPSTVALMLAGGLFVARRARAAARERADATAA